MLVNVVILRLHQNYIYVLEAEPGNTHVNVLTHAGARIDRLSFDVDLNVRDIQVVRDTLYASRAINYSSGSPTQMYFYLISEDVSYNSFPNISI